MQHLCQLMDQCLQRNGSSKGTKVKLNVLWLSEEQLNIMHLTEALGIAYDFVKLKSGSVKISNFNYEKQIYAYVAISGVFHLTSINPRDYQQ